MELLCQIKGQSCISCCTAGIERFSKEELDGILNEHTEAYSEHSSNLNEYLNSIEKNSHLCEYLGFNEGKPGCLIHPSKLGKEIRHIVPSNNPFRGKCTNKKSCNKEKIIDFIPEKIKERTLTELNNSKDYLDYSIKVKYLVPKVYVMEKLKGRSLNKLANSYLKVFLSRISREREAKNCFRLKARLDFLIAITKLLNIIG